MFKEKTSKKRSILNEVHKKDSSTLDEKHKQMIQTIQDNIIHKDTLSKRHNEYQSKLLKWKQQIQDLYNEQKQDTPEYMIAWDSNLYYSDKLRTIKRELIILNDETKEIEYYEKTGTILFNYYELITKQESIINQGAQQATSGTVALPSVKHRKKQLPTNQKNILDAFHIYNNQPNIETELSCQTVLETPECPHKDKMSLVNDYLLAIDCDHVKHINDTIINDCASCKIPLNCMIQEGIMICPMCGYQELLLVEQNRPIYRQSNKEASHCTYKRINHFNEWISQIQGKESTDIPEEIFEKIVNEIKKEKIKDLSKLSYNKMREILKKLHSNKYYEHIYYIIYRLNGIPAPNFSPDLEEKLRNMFKEIQVPFLKYCPPNRKNFLSYSYVLYKFCQLLEKDEYLKYFSLLKSREKLHVQDQIWKNICDDVFWEFIQSI
jgi:uncharacterized Zn finger protein (UPF0148 family)